MASVSIDAPEVRALVAEFKQVPDQLARHAKLVVAKGALNIKDQLRDEASRSRHFAMVPHINYDITDGGYGAEIGPEKVGAGNLANIAYFGGVNGGGGTVPDPRGAMDAEEPRFVKALADLAAELLR